MQGIRPTGAIMLVKFRSAPAKFHLNRWNMSPLWGEKPRGDDTAPNSPDKFPVTNLKFIPKFGTH